MTVRSENIFGMSETAADEAATEHEQAYQEDLQEKTLPELSEELSGQVVDLFHILQETMVQVTQIVKVCKMIDDKIQQ